MRGKVSFTPIRLIFTSPRPLEMKIPCADCGALILRETAERNGGLCMPCKAGTRANIESSKIAAKRSRELDANDPFRIYWRRLVDVVYKTPGGPFNSAWTNSINSFGPTRTSYRNLVRHSPSDMVLCRPIHPRRLGSLAAPDADWISGASTALNQKQRPRRFRVGAFVFDSVVETAGICNLHHLHT